MKRKLLFGLLVLILVVLPLLAACAKPALTPTPTPTAQGNWWDKLGTPEYGGTLTFRAVADAGNFDPWTVPWTSTNFGWYEQLVEYDWALDRNIWSFKTSWAPPEYCVGKLLESWEFKDPQTLVGHVRQGVTWHDKAPSYGREFTAEDIGYHFDRAFGSGSGFDKPNPWYLGWIPAIKGVAVKDRYTVEIYFKKPTPLANMWSVIEMAAPMCVENPDVVKADITDWKNVCGTGPFMLTDYIQNSVLTMTKNPNYWGKDARYPQNKLPYVDTVKVAVIPDMATAVAALRTGKLDMLSNVEWQQAQALASSNDELLQTPLPVNGYTVEFRCDNKPFTDIRVRKALQMAVDLETIGKSYYGGLVDTKAGGLISKEYPGYSIPFEEWPPELQQEYSYNPTGARKLLADAGYPNGFETNCIMSSGDDSALLQSVKAYFKDIGVDMEIKQMDQTTYMEYTLAFKHDQMVLTAMTRQVQPPNISIYQYDSNNATNLTKNNDPAYDALYDKYMASATTEEAKKNYIEADMYYLKQHWMVNLNNRVAFVVYQPYLKGYNGENTAGWASAYWWEHFWVDKQLKASMGR